MNTDDDNKELNNIFRAMIERGISYERELREESEEELMPGIDKGMVENFVHGEGLFYNPHLLESDVDIKLIVQENLRNLSEHLKQLPFDAAMEKLGIDDKSKMKELVEKAYFNSEAFAMRAARSLGYEGTEDMSPEHRAEYERILQIGKDSSMHLWMERDSEYLNNMFVPFGGQKYLLAGETLESTREAFKGIIENEDVPQWDDLTPQDAVAFVKRDDEMSKRIGVDTTGHEMGHYLYNGFSGLSPGEVNAFKKAEAELLDIDYDSKSYGMPESPLNHISDEKIVLNKNYLLVNGLTTDVSKDLTAEEETELKEKIKAHDNSGEERGADVHGVRLLMYEHGIYNMFDGTDITKEQVRKFQDLYPDSRIFMYWNRQQAGHFINNLASSEDIRRTLPSDNTPKTLDVSDVVWSASNARLTTKDDGRMILAADLQGKKIEYTLTAQETKDIQSKMNNRESLGNALSSLVLSQSISEQYQESVLQDMNNQLAMRR